MILNLGLVTRLAISTHPRSVGAVYDRNYCLGYNDATATAIYSLYTTAVYVACLPGGPLYPGHLIHPHFLSGLDVCRIGDWPVETEHQCHCR
jgi:hypothetical protein